MAQSVSCPDRSQLQQFLLGKVTAAEANQIETHLARCTVCEQLLDTLYSRDVELEGAKSSVAPNMPGTEQIVVDDLISKMKKLKAPLSNAGGHTATLDFSQREPVTDQTVDQTTPAEHCADEISSLLAPAEQPDEIGRLGPYRILKILGAGGMGVVFQAEDPTLRRLVALKVMKPTLGRDNYYRERFLREARAMAALDHDHIVPIYQVGEDRDILYLALPLLKGETLEDRIRMVKFLGWPEILRIASEVAKGLAVAHELGIIHRDIKPSNLWLESTSVSPGRKRFVGEGDRVKILDFGLAHPLNEKGAGQERVSIVGTPAYMSPEQARSLPVEVRSDLFSLGCILYRLCTEKAAFEKPDKLRLLLSVVEDHPRPVQEIKPDCPPGLAKLVMQLLAKDPKDRPASATAVAESADTIRRHLLQSPLRRRLKASGALVAACLLTWAGVAWGPWLYLYAANQAVVTLESEDETTLVLVKQNDRVVAELHPAKQRRARVPAGNVQLEIHGDPDGVQLDAPVLVLGRGDDEKVIVRRVPLVRGQLVLGSDEPLKVTLHRGGKQVAQLTVPAAANLDLSAGDYEVRLVSQPDTLRAFPDRVTIEAGEKTKITVRPVGEFRRISDPGAAVNGIAVDPHGKLLLAGMAGPDRAVGMWSLPDGQEIFYEKKHGSAVTAVALSRDGRLALSGGGEKGPRPDNTIRVWDLTQGGVIGTLEGSKQTITCVAFGVDPKVAFSGAGQNLTAWNLQEKTRLRFWLAHDTGIYSLAVLPDGKHLVTGGGEGQIHLWDIDKAQIVRSYTGHSDSVRSVAVSADGTKLASASWDGTIRCWEIATAKELHCFKGHQGWVQCVAISSNGKRVLSGGADKTVRLWDLELNDELLRYDGHTAGVTGVAFLLDGRQAVSGSKDQQLRVWKLP